MKIQNPFNEVKNAKLIKEYDSKLITNLYNKDLGINVEEYFKGVNSISLYECPDSKIRFFKPISVMGDSVFYEKLQQAEWYYMDWKWEQQYTLDMLDKSENILEIGSGKGNFVQKLTELGFSIKGLEMNEKEVEICRRKGLNVTDETLESLASKEPGTFSIICSFQVFEHIPDLDTVIQQSIKLLKPGGKLIFSVPNMDAFIKFNEGSTLNYPPHHVNWFYEQTFTYIAKKYAIQLKKLAYEPLQEYHYNWYAEYIKSNYVSGKLSNRIFYSGLGRKITFYLINKFAKKIKGHSILSIYEATA